MAKASTRVRHLHHARERGCNKRRYVNAHAAREANRTNSKRVRAYECAVCRAWHVTTQERLRE